ncbi:hypothetical protein [Variovorax sp.]|uniref:hypothetical protein n=1 Tax=Variovorax sp. TaxID=1871043 RepID=UPI002D6036FE|nr:hypothetical protein [Variovorax sp.]HYP83367.1 hypothetical protein [Variovorax sp.]
MPGPSADPTPSTGRLLVQGLSQALGFFLGALLGRYAGLLFGFDAFEPGTGYTGPAMAGIALIGLGGGGGVQAARLWYARRYGAPRP